ncbi:MAG: hypothetical protein WCP73_07770 [Eubacteriales bacterium]
MKVDGIHGPNTDAAINAFENDFLPNFDPNYTPKTVQKTVFPTVSNFKVSITTPAVNKQSVAPNGLDSIYSTGGVGTSYVPKTVRDVYSTGSSTAGVNTASSGTE